MSAITPSVTKHRILGRLQQLRHMRVALERDPGRLAVDGKAAEMRIFECGDHDQPEKHTGAKL